MSQFPQSPQQPDERRDASPPPPHPAEKHCAGTPENPSRPDPNRVPDEELDTPALRHNPHLRERPSFMDYERKLGHSKLNFETYEEFLAATANAPRSPGENPAPDASPASLRDPPRPPNQEQPRTKHRCTKQEKHRRLVQIGQLLIQGLRTNQIAQYAKLQWNIGKRMTQLYIQQVRKHWAQEASRADYLAHLWLAKQQREELYLLARQRLELTQDIRQFCSLLRVCDRHLKERDQLMREIREHREITQRDESPDSVQAQNQRARLVSMPYEEFFERLANLRNLWRWEWEQEKNWPEFVKAFREGRVCGPEGPYDPAPYEEWLANGPYGPGGRPASGEAE